MGKAFQHPVQKLTIGQAKKWMNSLDVKFKRSASTRQVAIYRADLKTYLDWDSKHYAFRGRLKRETHSRFGAYLTEQGGSKAACFDFIMNGSFADHERKLSSTQFKNPPSPILLAPKSW